MKTNELRIGNIVQYKKGHLAIIEGIQNWTSISVLGINDDYINGCYDTSNFIEVEINDILLLKLKFEVSYDGGYYREYSLYCYDFNFIVYLDSEGCKFFQKEFGNYIDIKGFHQLQNLYFALTCGELELSSNVA
ncbi:hypothetical protein UFOVP104_14 [uncultured Caudovirales phage]|uniref:Uncharacterized protein n=1 Tax=uncultured Caudovirales phage TaxID=2100421 RepID=A0A6J5LIG0_9CAUD|nr:hypothetical protein UFOVP104_14 [uncultured Caudovirales phage]CAB4134354.1 hypothetical protein UFOVP271_49 [uncultured Caudovirales phage]